jgi:hypothetical protein
MISVSSSMENCDLYRKFVGRELALLETLKKTLRVLAVFNTGEAED